MARDSGSDSGPVPEYSLPVSGFQLHGELRFRSTLRAFWRVPAARPSGLKSSTIHQAVPAGGLSCAIAWSPRSRPIRHRGCSRRGGSGARRSDCRRCARAAAACSPNSRRPVRGRGAPRGVAAARRRSGRQRLRCRRHLRRGQGGGAGEGPSPYRPNRLAADVAGRVVAPQPVAPAQVRSNATPVAERAARRREERRATGRPRLVAGRPRVNNADGRSAGDGDRD